MKKQFNVTRQIENKTVLNNNNGQWLLLVHQFRFSVLKFPFNQLSPQLDQMEIKRSVRLIVNHLQPSDREVIVILNFSISYNYLNPIIRLIKKNKIKKIYFFIFDVLRIRHPKAVAPLDRTVLETYPNDVRADELDMIEFISKSCNIEFEVYHNEANSKLFETVYKFPIKYYDLFSVDHVFNRPKYNKSNDFEYKLCCFNRRHEIYRSCIAALLYKQDNILLTLNHRYTLDSLMQNTILPIDKFSLDIKTKIVDGYTDILTNNIELTWDSTYQPNEFNNVFSDQLDYYNYNLDTIPQIRNSFLSVITETTFCSPMPNIGEKTLNPISVYRPFILMAAPHTLKLLQDLGFKTFDRWWDESYDSILNHNKRFEAIYYLVETILEKDISELTQILTEMSEVLEHNQKNMLQLNKKMFEINELDSSA